MNRLCLAVVLLLSARVTAAEPAWNAAEPSRVWQPVEECFAELVPYSHLGAGFGSLGPGELSWRKGVVCAERLAASGGMGHLLVSASDARESLDFGRCYSPWIEARYQPRCEAVTLTAKGSGPLRIEIKGPRDETLWSRQVTLQSDEYQDFRFPCRSSELKRARTLQWTLDAPASGCVDSLGLEIEYPDVPFSERVFLISYAKLSRCYNASLGTVRDKAHLPAGRQDSVPASGMFALATCAAWQLEIVSRDFAVQTLRQIHEQTRSLPTRHGLLPHFLEREETPEAAYRILPRSEFSTVDTAIYYHSMLLAAQWLEEEHVLSELTQACRSIEFDRLRDEAGFVRHGVRENESVPLRSVWSDWGGETALVLLLQAIADPQAVARMDRSGRVFRGVGFIAEIQSLFYPHFSRAEQDRVSGVNWRAARRELFRRQRSYFDPETAAGRLGVFGLSAGEGPRGRGYFAHGVEEKGVEIIHPHYMLLSWEHWDDPRDLYLVLRRLEEKELLPPWGLIENVDADLTEYLPMNGALNASFESLAAYHLWARANGRPDAIYEAAESCEPIRRALASFYP